MAKRLAWEKANRTHDEVERLPDAIDDQIHVGTLARKVTRDLYRAAASSVADTQIKAIERLAADPLCLPRFPKWPTWANELLEYLRAAPDRTLNPEHWCTVKRRLAALRIARDRVAQGEPAWSDDYVPKRSPQQAGKLRARAKMARVEEFAKRRADFFAPQPAPMPPPRSRGPDDR